MMYIRVKVCYGYDLIVVYRLVLGLTESEGALTKSMRIGDRMLFAYKAFCVCRLAGHVCSVILLIFFRNRFWPA